MRHLTLYIIILLLVAPITATAQEDEDSQSQKEIDSILSLIKPDTPDSEKAKYYYEIASTTGNSDSIIKYASLSLDYCDKKDDELIFINQLYIIESYQLLGKYQQALEYAFMALQSCADTSKFVAWHLQNIALTYNYMNKTDSMTFYFNKSLDLSIKNKDTACISFCYEHLGLSCSNRGLLNEAKNFYEKALEIDSASGDILKCAYDYYRLGENVTQKDSLTTNDFYTAKYYFIKALNIFDSIWNDAERKYWCYESLAALYIEQAKNTGEKKFADTCAIYMKKCEVYYSNLAKSSTNYYYHVYILADYYIFCNQNNDALAAVLDIGKNFNEETDPTDWCDYYEKLKQIYTNLGDYKKALECSEKYNKYKQKNLNDSTVSAISDFKAEQAVKIEKLERETAEKLHIAEKRRMWILIIALFVGLGLVVRIFWVKRKAHKALAEKNEILQQQKTEIETQRDEIETQRDEIEAQRDEIEAQRDDIIEQKNKIESQRNEIIKSVNYAQRIQQAAVSKIDEVRDIFPESFVYYKPRDIVSGDYYRCGRCGKYAVMVTADCTGHGIPGAFLSMLGLSGLKEYLVTEYDAENPGTVLDRMRDFIKTTLVSSQNNFDIKDGMDMTICCFDFEAMELRYAIANQNAYIVRNGEKILLKGDAMPVGRYYAEKEHFQTLSTPLQHGDTVYMFSDGIQDQFGGEAGNERKFMRKNLINLLASNFTLPMSEQMSKLNEAITAWRGNRAQIDDMTLVGIRVA